MPMAPYGLCIVVGYEAALHFNMAIWAGVRCSNDAVFWGECEKCRNPARHRSRVAGRFTSADKADRNYHGGGCPKDWQGGSQDMQTGLVWLDWTKANGSLWSQPTARDQAAACTVGGYSDWRLPTRAEMTAAVTNQISLNCPLSGSAGIYFIWWSSNTKGSRSAYAMDLRSGNGQFYLSSTSECGS